MVCLQCYGVGAVIARDKVTDQVYGFGCGCSMAHRYSALPRWENKYKEKYEADCYRKWAPIQAVPDAPPTAKYTDDDIPF